MASSCQHPDARWLTDVCAGRDVTTKEDSKRVFSALGQNDARALCFSWLCCAWLEQRDLAPLRRSAELGFAFAQALIAQETRGEEKFKFAQLAAAQGERGGFYELGRCFRDGEGCKKDLDKAKENYLRASELEDVAGMRLLGEMFDESSPQRWGWWGRAAALGNWSGFLYNFEKQVNLFNSGTGSAAVMFAIGQALQGHVNEDERTIFGEIVFQFSHWPSKASNRILRGANPSNERCHACMDSSRHQDESCEGREKGDREIDLGFKRRSVVRRVGNT
jgi:hypothetical protein